MFTQQPSDLMISKDGYFMAAKFLHKNDVHIIEQLPVNDVFVSDDGWQSVN